MAGFRRRYITANSAAGGQTVVEFSFRDAPPELRRWWLLLAADDVDICDEDPGLDTDALIDTTLQTFVRVWRGDLGWNDALAGDRLRIHATRDVARRVPHWFRLSHFATVPRP